MPINQLPIGETGITELKRKVTQSLEEVSIIYSLTDQEITKVTDEDKKENILHVDYLNEIYEVSLSGPTGGEGKVPLSLTIWPFFTSIY